MNESVAQGNMKGAGAEKGILALWTLKDSANGFGQPRGASIASSVGSLPLGSHSVMGDSVRTVRGRTASRLRNAAGDLDGLRLRRFSAEVAPTFVTSDPTGCSVRAHGCDSRQQPPFEGLSDECVLTFDELFDNAWHLRHSPLPLS